MKHLKLYFSILALAAIFTLAACSSDEYHEDPSFSEEIKEELVDKSQLPQWLADYVTYLEYVPEGQKNHEMSENTVKGIYRFEWNDKSFYELYSPNQATVHANLYTADGMPVNLMTTYSKSFGDNVRNWTIVYLLHPIYEMPQNIIYPIDSRCLEVTDTITQRLLTYNANPNEFKPWGHNFYAVSSEEQFRYLFGKSAVMPDIDINLYTLVLEFCEVPEGYRQKRQEINTKGEKPILKIYFEKEKGLNDVEPYQQNSELLLIWSLYPKLPLNTGEVRICLNNEDDMKRFINGGFVQPTAHDNAEFALDIYCVDLNTKRIDTDSSEVVIQIPGDGTIKGKAGSTPFSGKIDFSNFRIEENMILKGDIRIHLDDVTLSEEKDHVAVLFLKNLERMRLFEYYNNDCIVMKKEEEDCFFIFMRKNNYFR